MAMQHRGDTTANISSTDPYLRMGEVIVETDDPKDAWIGDGLHKTSQLVKLEPRSGILLLDHTTLGVNTTQVNVTVPDRDDLVKLEIWVRTRGSSTGGGLYARFNGETGAHYDVQDVTASAGTATASSARAQGQYHASSVPTSSAEADQWGSTIIEVPFPRKIGPWRSAIARGGRGLGTSTGNLLVVSSAGWLRKVYKIDTVNLFLSSGDLLAGTQIMTLGWVDN